VTGKTLISAPIPCGSCHVVPADVAAPTHIDGLRPAEVTFSGLALTDAAAPKWDHATASCSGAYCHGGGASLSRDTSAQVKAPVWTQGTSQAFCGACHGIPPSTPPHSPSFSLSSCAGCHPKTVTAQGNIIISGPPEARTSFHINGVVNAP
jgi:predicted CxxxxCH...CXXCH cytochrome family protein